MSVPPVIRKGEPPFSFSPWYASFPNADSRPQPTAKSVTQSTVGSPACRTNIRCLFSFAVECWATADLVRQRIEDSTQRVKHAPFLFVAWTTFFGANTMTGLWPTVIRTPGCSLDDAPMRVKSTKECNGAGRRFRPTIDHVESGAPETTPEPFRPIPPRIIWPGTYDVDKA